MGQLLAQRQNLCVKLRRIAALSRRLIAGAQLYQPGLHLGSVQAGKLLFLQLLELIFQQAVPAGQLGGLFLPLVVLSGCLILLALEVDHALLQLSDFFPLQLQKAVGREDIHPFQRRPGFIGKLFHHGLPWDHGQVHLQQVFALIPQLLDEIEGIEDGQEHVPFAE